MRRVTRVVASLASSLLAHGSPASVPVTKYAFTTMSVPKNLQNLQEKSLPSEIVKWGSLGFFRTSRFASGFTPLQPKPLDSIMDLERAEDRSAEDLASIWDDVMPQISFLFVGY